MKFPVSAVAFAMAAVSCAGVARGNPLGFPEYSQTVEVTFASGEEAARAEMKISPLPDGAVRSFGTRWDDTYVKHLDKASMLERAGVKGAFYITAGQGKSDAPESFRYAGICELVKRGHAIGNHSMTHPVLVNYSPEHIFEQILQTRIDLENDTDHAVTSYAAPFGWYGQRWLDASLQSVVVKMLVECGMWVSGDNPISHLEIPEDVWYPAHRFSANDRAPDHVRFLDGLKTQSAIADKSPLSPRITLGTHSWCDEKGNALQEKWIKENCVRPDWAQLNDYEYGAYRYSVINGAVSRMSVSGNKAVFSVRRFCPATLGDGIALSVAFSGNPLKAECNGMPLERGKSGTWRLPHDASRTTLSKIGIADETGKCGKFPGVEMQVLPDVTARKVRVVFANRTSGALDALYGTVHLPPEFKNRRRTFGIESIAAGKTEEIAFDFLEPEPAVFARGTAMYAASVDFSCGGLRNRIWATAKAWKKSSALLPADVAMVTKILPADKLDSKRLQEISAATGRLEPVAGGVEWMKRTKDDKKSCYAVDRHASQAERDAVAKSGVKMAYAIALQFKVREGAEAKLITNAKACRSSAELYLNGARIELPEKGGDVNAVLRPGINRVVMKIPAVSTRNLMEVQLAACEKGLLCSPCECVALDTGCTEF